MGRTTARILVLGSGDVGSAVAHALFRAGHRVVLHDGPKPPHARRGMAFTDAFFEGRCDLAGVFAKRASGSEGLDRMIACGRAVPVTDDELAAVLETIRPEVVVDARLRKHEPPAPLNGLAPFTIGLGPDFTAAVQANVVIETAWGSDLGRVIRQGQAAPLQGEPREIAGHARDRYVYAPVGGVFETRFAVGDPVEAGQLVARIGDTPLHAPLSGILRGLTHPGARVIPRVKVVEVDPRGDRAAAFGLGERPARIAAGVLQALG